jgi:hypothetical protein
MKMRAADKRRDCHRCSVTVWYSGDCFCSKLVQWDGNCLKHRMHSGDV